MRLTNVVQFSELMTLMSLFFGVQNDQSDGSLLNQIVQIQYLTQVIANIILRHKT